jgi:hypothetical protein
MAATSLPLLRFAKGLVVPRGPRKRTILTGPLRGIRMDLDLATQTQLYLGLFERELHPWIERLSCGAATVVDVGAAHGEYTLFALLKTTADRVIAFEPDPAMLARLRRNLHPYAAAAARLQLHQARLGATDSNRCVSVATLARSIVGPCLVKMDIDGGEGGILKAAAETGFLDVPDLRWIIETHSQSLEEYCLSILGAHGYTTSVVPNAWWRTLVPEHRSAHNRWLAATRPFLASHSRAHRQP